MASKISLQPGNPAPQTLYCENYIPEKDPLQTLVLQIFLIPPVFATGEKEDRLMNYYIKKTALPVLCRGEQGYKVMGVNLLFIDLFRLFRSPLGKPIFFTNNLFNQTLRLGFSR